jgi:GT2 family glycosyltransferase
MKISPMAVLIACHNRRLKTIRCIQSLQTAAIAEGLRYHLIVFDDGSTDGTCEAVLEIEPTATVLRGDGSYYWNRSMYTAFQYATGGDYASYLWLNDDTNLYQSAFRSIKACLKEHEATDPPIVVGAIRDPDSGRMSYGGGYRPHPKLRPFHYHLVIPGGKPTPVDVMNGNVVWIPEIVAQRLGNLNPTFEHGMGDIDYSLRARKEQVAIVQSPDFVGECPRNEITGTFEDPHQPLMRRLKHIVSLKGLPWRTWMRMCLSHGGVLAPFLFVWPYLKVLIGTPLRNRQAGSHD